MNPALLPRALTAGSGGLFWWRSGALPARPNHAGQGLVRNQLGPRGRARRIFPGPGRRHLQEIRARRHHRAGRPQRQQPHAADRRQARLLHGREHADVVRCGRQQRAGGDGRRHVPEGSAGFPDPSGIEGHQARRPQAADAVRVQGRHHQLFSMAEIRIRIQRGQRSGPTPSTRSRFIANKQSAMQGYVTSEPFAVEKAPNSSRGSSCWRTMASTPTRP